jgi:hypothetical protein
MTRLGILPLGVVALSAAVSLLGCAGSPSGSVAAPSGPSAPLDEIVTRVVVPSDTWPAIEPTIGNHFVAIGPAATRAGRLFVFYPGTGASPDRYTYVLKRAASLGFHAIGLAYHNAESINFAICPMQPQTCHRAARLEILLGIESGYTPPDVDAENGAFHRLQRLLEHLARTFPGESWSRYLDPATGEPLWRQIAFGGHSQGGGHAAMTAQLHAVDRALLFGATEPVAWTAEPFETEDERLFGFAHTEEPSYEPIVRSWALIGLPGAITTVDGAAAPFDASHRLATSFPGCRGNPADRGYYHNCPVVDDYLPIDAGGRPRFSPVWDYMLSAPVSAEAGVEQASRFAH